MKKLIMALSLLLVMAVAYALGTGTLTDRTMRKNDIGQDAQGHRLVALWNKQEKAGRADKPESRLAILEEIIESASRAGYDKDFYDAWKMKCIVTRELDWHKSVSVREEMNEAVAGYGSAFLSVYHHINGWNDINWENYSKDNFVKEVSEELVGKAKYFEKNNHREFYSYGENTTLKECIMASSRNDLQFFALSLAESQYFNELDSLLFKNVEFGWPASGYMDYIRIYRRYNSPQYGYAYKSLNQVPGFREALENFALEHKDDAFSLFARADLLAMKFHDYKNHKSGGIHGHEAEANEEYDPTSADYEALRDEAESIVSDEVRFASDHELIAFCTKHRELLEELNEKNIAVAADEDSVYVKFRNVKEAQLTIFARPDSKEIFKDKLDNAGGGFYVENQKAYALPKGMMPDGEYEIRVNASNVRSARTVYNKYSLSMAVVSDAEGWLRVYVADYKTGEPCKKATFVLSEGDSKTRVENVELRQGFTKLPLRLTKKSYVGTLTAIVEEEDGRVRKSDEVSVYSREFQYGLPSDSHGKACAVILTDRGAYNPGDSLKFKVVAYMDAKQVGVITGKRIVVALYDADDNELEDRKLPLNAYGSASGEFLLPEGSKNGLWCIKAYLENYNGEDRYCIKTIRVRVDEFVTPTFTLVFDKDNRLHLPGETVEVSGKVEAYSGHSLGNAKLQVEISRRDKIVSFQEEIGNDGRFAFSFKSLDDEWDYEVSVKVSDGTGETAEYDLMIPVRSYLTAEASMLNAEKNVGMKYVKPELNEGDWSTYMSALQDFVLDGDVAEMNVKVTNSWRGPEYELPLLYLLRDASGHELRQGKFTSGKQFEVDMTGLAPGSYTISFKFEGEKTDKLTFNGDREIVIFKADFDAGMQACEAKNYAVSHIFHLRDAAPKKGEAIRLDFLSQEGVTWAVFELMDNKTNVLETKALRSDENEIAHLEFQNGEDRPERMYLHGLYCKNGRIEPFSQLIVSESPKKILPLDIVSFENAALPGRKYSLTLHSEAGAEAAVTVYDKSYDVIAVNAWRPISLAEREMDFRAVVSYEAGKMGAPWASGYNYRRRFSKMYRDGDDGMDSVAEMSEVSPMMMANAAADYVGMIDYAESAEMTMDNAAGGAGDREVSLRSDFASTLLFSPHVIFGSDGNAEVEFKTSDRLSTFNIKVFAHTKDVRTAVAEREMTVTLPVKVNVVAPAYLYEGDEYLLAATVSSSAGEDLEGTLVMSLYEGGNMDSVPYREVSVSLTVKAGDGASHYFKTVLPDTDGKMGVKVAFYTKTKSGNNVYDGVLVPVSILPAAQSLVESHSAFIRDDSERNAVIDSLREAFVNVDPASAKLREISAWDIMMESFPSKIVEHGNDLISMMESYYAISCLEKLKEGVQVQTELPDLTSKTKLVEKIGGCQNEDGGFAWFSGMDSNDRITAKMLKYMAVLEDEYADSLLCQYSEKAVRYLDRAVCEDFVRAYAWKHGLVQNDAAVRSGDIMACRPWRFSGISLAEYLNVRMNYPEVDFDFGTIINKSSFDVKDLPMSAIRKEFGKAVREYLTDDKMVMLRGCILDRALRASTLMRLRKDESDLVASLCRSGERRVMRKASKTLAADMASLMEYAVPHRSGGFYYPNAVMPFRGMMESEAYAHALLAELMYRYGELAGQDSANSRAREIETGIGLWLMVQKETQKWETTADYIEVLNLMVKRYDSDYKNLKVAVMSGETRTPFDGIKESGNEMTVRRNFYHEITKAEEETLSEEERKTVIGIYSSGRNVLLFPDKAGREYKVGDKVYAVCRMHSDENRSFVKLTVPREAALRPVEQLSGMCWGNWRFEPWRSGRGVGHLWMAVPNAYRNVKTDRTEYYFDVLPEQNSMCVEAYYVIQSGKFECPVVEVESLYAPHYRANAVRDGYFEVFE